MFELLSKNLTQWMCLHKWRFIQNVTDKAEVAYYGQRCSVWVCDRCHKTRYEPRIYERDLKGKVIMESEHDDD